MLKKDTTNHQPDVVARKDAHTNRFYLRKAKKKVASRIPNSGTVPRKSRGRGCNWSFSFSLLVVACCLHGAIFLPPHHIASRICFTVDLRASLSISLSLSPSRLPVSLPPSSSTDRIRFPKNVSSPAGLCCWPTLFPGTISLAVLAMLFNGGASFRFLTIVSEYKNFNNDIFYNLYPSFHHNMSHSVKFMA